MSDKVSGRGHKISPINGKSTKFAYNYSPCPQKIDPDYLGIPSNNGENKNYNIFHAMLQAPSQLQIKGLE